MTHVATADVAAGELPIDNSVRVATNADLDSIMELERAGFLSAEQWSRASWESELTESAMQVLIIGSPSPLGVIALRLAGPTVELDRIVVHPQARRNGIAGNLINSALDQLQDFEEMILEVWSGNVPAIMLYRSFGFAELITRRDYYAPGRDAVIMRLSLPAGRAAEGDQ